MSSGFVVNPSERAFVALARERGWSVTRSGWPDFWCELPAGGFAVVEVKSRNDTGGYHALKLEQWKRLKWFAEHGVQAFVSDGATLEAFDPAVHGARYAVPEWRFALGVAEREGSDVGG